MTPKTARTSADPVPAVQACHDLLGWMIPQIEKFPRQRRFTLGERLESGGLELLELLVEASYTRSREALLNRANTRLSTLRHLWRLAYELKTLPHRPYHHGADRLVELGRQIGGWRKAAQGHA